MQGWRVQRCGGGAVHGERSTVKPQSIRDASKVPPRPQPLLPWRAAHQCLTLPSLMSSPMVDTTSSNVTLSRSFSCCCVGGVTGRGGRAGARRRGGGVVSHIRQSRDRVTTPAAPHAAGQVCTVASSRHSGVKHSPVPSQRRVVWPACCLMNSQCDTVGRQRTAGSVQANESAGWQLPGSGCSGACATSCHACVACALPPPPPPPAPATLPPVPLHCSSLRLAGHSRRAGDQGRAKRSLAPVAAA